MHIIKDDFCIRSAELDDAVFLCKERNDKLPDGASLSDVIFQIKENKIRLGQLVVVEIQRQIVGEMSYALSFQTATLDFCFYDEKKCPESLQKIILSDLLSFLFFDGQLRSMYAIKKVVSDVDVTDFSKQLLLQQTGFIKKEIRYGMIKRKNAVTGDLFIYQYDSDQYEQSHLFVPSFPILLFDVDNTILDFDMAERKSLTKALLDIHVEPTDELLALYHKINVRYWEKVERNEMSRNECLTRRFVDFFASAGISYEATKMEELYRNYLNISAYVVPHARKVLQILEKNHDLYIITNGVKKTQEHRLKKAHLDHFFKKKFISEEIGANKPSQLFLKAVEEQIEGFDRNKALIIGDSLSSDILLGRNHQIKTCWFNKSKIKNQSEICPDYVITDLRELILHEN